MKRVVIGLALWFSLIVAVVVGLWVGGSCAMFKKMNAHRPPVMLHIGSIYHPHVDEFPNRSPSDNWNLLGRITIPTRPVGVWADVVYNVGQSNVQATSFGFFIAFPPGPEGPEAVGEEEELTADPTIVPQLPTQR